MNDYPNQYQICTVDKDGYLLHAGVHGAARLSKKAAIKQERKWLIWRREYIATHPGNYPLASDAVKRPAFILMHPVENPKERIWVEFK